MYFTVRLGADIYCLDQSNLYITYNLHLSKTRKFLEKCNLYITMCDWVQMDTV